MARERKMVTPSTSWKAVSKGPAVSAGSKPSRFESIGMMVPAIPGQRQERHLIRGAPLQLGRVGAGDAEDVLGGFLLHDVDDVVHRDGAEQSVLLVDHRQAHQIVLGHEPGHVFAVHLRAHAHELVVEQRGERGPRIRDEQPAEGNPSHQVPVIVDDVQLEGPLLGDRAPEVLDRLLHGKALGEGHDVARHEPPPPTAPDTRECPELPRTSPPP